MKKKEKISTPPPATTKSYSRFHIEFKNAAQKLAWAGFQQHDILFLSGPAGTGKTLLATAFAINEVLQKRKKRIVLTRPIVESGESLGFLPGDFYEKVNPFMMPFFDCMRKLCGENNPQRDIINAAVEIAPLAYLRGRTLDNSVCILDEAQNCSLMQLKLFLTRFGEDSKIIVTGDPTQSDFSGPVALSDVMFRLGNVPGIGIVKFDQASIVRHPLVSKVIERLGND